MPDLPLHPKLVHLPIALAVLMPLLTSGLLLAWWRGLWPKHTWWLAILGQALLLASGLLAMGSGEGDEERVERIVPEAALAAHEAAAEAFVWGGGIVLVLAFAPLVLRSRRAAQVAGALTVAGTAAVLALGYRVGQQGGELVYRHGAAAAFASGAAKAPAVPPARHGDDDDR